MFAQRLEGCEFKSHPGPNSVVPQIWKKYIYKLSLCISHFESPCDRNYPPDPLDKKLRFAASSKQVGVGVYPKIRRLWVRIPPRTTLSGVFDLKKKILQESFDYSLLYEVRHGPFHIKGDVWKHKWRVTILQLQEFPEGEWAMKREVFSYTWQYFFKKSKPNTPHKILISQQRSHLSPTSACHMSRSGVTKKIHLKHVILLAQKTQVIMVHLFSITLQQLWTERHDNYTVITLPSTFHCQTWQLAVTFPSFQEEVL